MSAFESKWLDYAPTQKRVGETPKSATDKTDKSPKHVVPAGVLPQLPWQLERLVAAASSGQLPKGRAKVGSGVVFDLAAYSLANAACYLIGDRDEALRRLWQAHGAWQDEAN